MPRRRHRGVIDYESGAGTKSYRMKELTWWMHAGSLESAGSAGATSVQNGDVQLALDALLQNLSIPNTDNAPVTEHLDAKIRAIADAVTTLNQASFARIMPLRRERNTRMPINRLPAEVLNEILAGTVEKKESYAPVVNLMKVCKHWHDFILNTPTFWNYISDGYDRKVVSMLLERSKSTPLRVYYTKGRRSRFDTPNPYSEFYTESDTESDTGTDPIPPVIAEVRHHFNRWEDVELSLDSVTAERLLLETPAPILRKFDLSLRPSIDIDPEINLFDGHAPQLESLSISGWALPWTSPVFNRLITLHMSRIEAKPPSVGDLILILKASPVLSDFQLSDTIIVASDRESLRSPITPTSLSHLRTWRTTEVDINAMELLLEHFEMPAVSSVCLGLPRGTEWDNPPAPGSSIQGLFDLVLQGQGDVGMDVGYADFKLWKKAGITISLSMTRESAQMYLSWAVACYGSSLTDKVTSFTCNGEVIDNDILIRMLSSMESLEELHLDSYWSLDKVLEYLKRPSFTGSVGVWPLPRLHSFHLDDCGWSTPDALLVALQWRYGIVLKNIEGLEVVLPDRLTFCNANGGASGTELHKIRSLVGDFPISRHKRSREFDERDIFGGSDSKLSSEHSSK